MKFNWINKENLKSEKIDNRLLEFLMQEGSLTRFLQEKGLGEFQIDVETEGWDLAMPDETESLTIDSDTRTFIRESWLKLDGKKIIFARTVIPKESLQGENKVLGHLADKPLGEALFADETTERTSIQFSRIVTDCNLYERIRENTNKGEDVWGRRSLFYKQNKPLLITEIFLPRLLTCIKP